MRQYIDAASILSEAKMMWASCKKIYIFVEGKTDRIFFKTLFKNNSSISFRALEGWENVYSVISLAQKENFTKTLGIIDRDYHHINNDGINQSEQLIFTDDNDIEMMLFNSSSYDKFLEVCGNENKLKLIDDKRKLILNAAFPIGVLRCISLLNNYCLCFDGLDCKSIIDKNNLDLLLDKLVQKVIERTRSKGIKINVSTEDLISQITQITNKEIDKDYCNGHDVFNIICIAMTKLYATASANEYTPDKIFNCLLIGYSDNEFQKTTLHNKISKWIVDNI